MRRPGPLSVSIGSRQVAALAVVALVVLAGCAGAGGGGDGGGFDAGGGGGGDGGSFGGGDGADAASADGGQVGLAVGGGKDVNNLRNNVQEGYLPLREDLTHEGLFYDYYFDTGKSEPCEKLFCPTYSKAVSRDPLSNETERYMTVGLNSGIDKADFERKKLNLVVVVDTSGSMSDAFDRYYYDAQGNKHETERQRKMTAAKRALTGMTDQLGAGDRVGVVGFDGDARTVVPMKAVGDRDMDRVDRQIRTLSPGGSTDLAAGMNAAREMIQPYAGSDPEEYETRVIYLTDAMPNEGQRSAGGLKSRLQADADAGIYSTFVGVGVDFNSKLVTALSDVRGANHYTVHSGTRFQERMDSGFQYMVTPLVFDLNLQVDSEAYRIESVYGAPGGDASSGQLMHVNTLFASKSKNGTTKGGVVLLELERTGPGGGPVTLTASYENRAGEEFASTKTVRFADRDAPYYENTGIRKAIALARYGDLLGNWIAYERRVIRDADPETPESGIESHEWERLGQWERTSTDLQVSAIYRERIDRFATYFRGEVRAVGDETMRQELDVMRRLVRVGGGAEEANDERETDVEPTRNEDREGDDVTTQVRMTDAADRPATGAATGNSDLNPLQWSVVILLSTVAARVAVDRS